MLKFVYLSTNICIDLQIYKDKVFFSTGPSFVELSYKGLWILRGTLVCYYDYANSLSPRSVLERTIFIYCAIYILNSIFHNFMNPLTRKTSTCRDLKTSLVMSFPSNVVHRSYKVFEKLNKLLRMKMIYNS